MKYIISSGKSVISKTVFRDDTLIGFQASVEDNAAKFDTIGDAMRSCAKVNKLIGSASFQVMSVNN